MYHKYEPNRSYAVKQECEEVVDSYSFKLVECKSDRPNFQEGEGLSGGGGGCVARRESNQVWITSLLNILLSIIEVKVFFDRLQTAILCLYMIYKLKIKNR